MILLFVICFIWFLSAIVVIVFGTIFIVGICGIFSDRRKKSISISSRGTGTVDENGNVTNYRLQGFEIVNNEKPQKTKNER
jgi:cbb3-type cytochrome oxidase subunit 3